MSKYEVPCVNGAFNVEDAAFVGTVRFWAPPKASTELLFHRPCLRCAGRYSIGAAIFEPVSGGPGHGT